MTASTTYATAMADLEAALEVEAAATPGPWEQVVSGAIEAANYGEVIVPGPVSCMTRCYGGSSTLDGDRIEMDGDLIVLARSIVRRSLLNAKETLEQHRPTPDEIDEMWCGGDHPVPFRWERCREVRRALALVNDIPEGGAK